MSEDALSRYSNPDNDPRGPWKSDPATAQAGHATPNQFYVFTGPDGREHHLPSGRCWLFTKDVFEQKARDGMIWFGKNNTGVPRVKTYLNSKERGLTPESMWFAKEASTNEGAKTYLKTLFDGLAVFDTPKPVELIETALTIGASDGIVLDFFSGSSPTAEAVFRLGKGNRFILIQMPEECDRDSEGYKAGYETVADIGKDRIRRAGSKLVQKSPLTAQEIDIGFRVLKVDTSNMKDVYYKPDGVKQGDLLDQIENIKEDRTPEDLLFQVLLDWGVDLSLPIANEGELILYQTQEGTVRIEVLYESETFWLNQKKIAELFGVDLRTISYHLGEIYASGELSREATLRKIRRVQIEGSREVSREIEFYNLDAIISVGYRVNSAQATRFRIWATQTLREFVIKGFVLDDERLKLNKRNLDVEMETGTGKTYCYIKTMFEMNKRYGWSQVHRRGARASPSAKGSTSRCRSRPTTSRKLRQEGAVLHLQLQAPARAGELLVRRRHQRDGHQHPGVQRRGARTTGASTRSWTTSSRASPST
jgi:hypothetical protein